MEMAQGLIDADLGGGVVKKRIGLAGRQLDQAVEDATLEEICHDKTHQNQG